MQEALNDQVDNVCLPADGFQPLGLATPVMTK